MPLDKRCSIMAAIKNVLKIREYFIEEGAKKGIRKARDVQEKKIILLLHKSLGLNATEIARRLGIPIYRVRKVFKSLRSDGC